MNDRDVVVALKVLADEDRRPPDPAADLARARAASRDRLRRRLQVGSVATALLLVAGVGVGRAMTDDSSPGAADAGRPAGVSPVHLVSATFAADPYTFDLTPEGWSVQGQTPQAVTIAPDNGHTSTSPYDFIGKLVILFDENPPGGKTYEDHGRLFWIRGDSGYTTLSTRTRAGEPVGVVRVQYPDDTGWTRSAMLRFLGSVHVGPSARPGLG